MHSDDQEELEAVHTAEDEVLEDPEVRWTLAALRGYAVIEAAYLVASQSLQRLREEAANRDEDEVLEVQPAEVYGFVICKSYLQDSPPSC